MSVKIYDASAGTFKDAPTPQIYDASTQAYKESKGLVYDTSKGAWDERWGSDRVWLYRNGNEYNPITGGWTVDGWKVSSWSIGAIKSYKDGNIALLSSSRFAICGTGTPIDLTEYSWLNYEVKDIKTFPEVGMWVLGNKSYTNVATYQYVSSSGSHRLDISSIKGNFYIAYTCSNYDSPLPNAYSEFNNVWLEI